jgi:hypothetical protein
MYRWFIVIVSHGMLLFLTSLFMKLSHSSLHCLFNRLLSERTFWVKSMLPSELDRHPHDEVLRSFTNPWWRWMSCLPETLDNKKEFLGE